MNVEASAPATHPRPLRWVLPLALCASLPLLAGLVAAYGWSPVTDTLIVVEFLFVLVVAPRLTKRLISSSLPDLTAAHVTPALRGVVEDALKAMKQDVAAAVIESLKAAQMEAMRGAPDPIEKVRVAFREELAAALEQLDSEPIAPEDAAVAMGQKSGDVRRTFASQEALFRQAIQKFGGAPAIFALDASVETGLMPRPTYKLYAGQGLDGARALLKDAPKLGIRLPDGLGDGVAPGAAVSKGTEGVRFI